MKIKFISEQVEPGGIPQVRAPLNIGLGVSKGLFHASESLEAAGRDWERVGRMQQAIDEKEKRYNDLFSAVALHQDGATQISQHQDYLKQLNYGDVVPEAENSLKDIKTRLLDRAKTEKFSPEAIRLFEKDWLALSGQAMIKARDIDNTKFKEKSIQGALQLKNMAVDESIPMSQEGRDRLFTGVDMVWDNLARDGIVSGEHAFNHKQDMRQKAETKTREVMEEIRKQDEKEAETRADAALTDRYGSDYGRIMQELDKPGVYSREFGLTVQQATNLKIIVHNRQVQFNQLVDQAQEQTAVKFRTMLRENSLSHEQVKDAVEYNWIKREVGDSLDRAIDVQTSQMDGKVKTDPGTFTRLLSLAWSHPDKEFVKAEIFKNIDQLEEADIEKIVGRNESKAQTIEDRARARAAERIHRYKFPHAGQMINFFATRQDEEELANAYRALDGVIENARAAGKPLTADQIDDAAQKIAEQMRPVLPDIISQMTEKTRQAFEKTGKKQQKAKETPKRKPGESIADYLKRTGQE